MAWYILGRLEARITHGSLSESPFQEVSKTEEENEIEQKKNERFQQQHVMNECETSVERGRELSFSSLMCLITEWFFFLLNDLSSYWMIFPLTGWSFSFWMIFCRFLASSLSKFLAFQKYHIPRTMSNSVDLRGELRIRIHLIPSDYSLNFYSIHWIFAPFTEFFTPFTEFLLHLFTIHWIFAPFTTHRMFTLPSNEATLPRRWWGSTWIEATNSGSSGVV